MGELFGLLGGVPPSDGSAGKVSGKVYCNARADECSSGHVARGERAVYFRGAEYKVVGFYFVSTPSGACDLCYILRAVSDDTASCVSTETVHENFTGSPTADARGRSRRSTVPPGTQKSAWRRRSRMFGSPPPVADD